MATTDDESDDSPRRRAPTADERDDVRQLRSDLRGVEARLRGQEEFRASLVGAVGVPGVLERVEEGFDRLGDEVAKEIAGLRAELATVRAEHGEVKTRLRELAGVYGKVLIAATSGGA